MPSNDRADLPRECRVRKIDFFLKLDSSSIHQYLEAIVLGLVEGITEFLPISSMAHMKVVPMLLGWGDQIGRAHV